MSKRKSKDASITKTEPPGEVEAMVSATITDSEPLSKNFSMRSETRYGVVYNARYVNVRIEASQMADVIRVANEGERVIILYEENGFYKVEFEDGTSGFVAMEFIDEVHGGNPDAFFSKSESILTSVKKLLGIEETCEEFDLDILMNINAAIFTLRQLGIGPAEGFQVTNKNVKYSDYLGEDSRLIPDVKMYLYYKTKLGFDPPTSSYVMDCIKQMISECEWRLNIEVDPEDTFE